MNAVPVELSIEVEFALGFDFSKFASMKLRLASIITGERGEETSR